MERKDHRDKAFLIEIKEWIGQLKPDEIATKIGEWYNLPPDVVERGKKTKIALVAPQTLIRKFQAWDRELREIQYQIDYPIGWLETGLLDAQNRQPPLPVLLPTHYQPKPENIPMVFIPNKDSSRTIYINEAATEILRIAGEMGNEEPLYPQDLYRDNRLTLSSPYFYDIDPIIAMMVPGRFRDNAITVQDLAQYYFGLKGEDANHPVEFILELVSSWHPHYRKDILRGMFGISHIPNNL